MFSFTAKGRIGRIDRPKNNDAIVRLSIGAERIVRGQTDTFTKTEWLVEGALTIEKREKSSVTWLFRISPNMARAAHCTRIQRMEL